jgi:hypothetical protein
MNYYFLTSNLGIVLAAFTYENKTLAFNAVQKRKRVEILLT